MTDFFEHIKDAGFEGTLEQLIAYTETQAKLHQLFGDRSQWEFWVRSWANLQRAADAMVCDRPSAIALGGNDQDCLEMWRECHKGSASLHDFDFSDN